VVRKYVKDEFKKRVDLIQEIWDLAQTTTIFSTRIPNLKEYLQNDLENNEEFYKESLNTFSSKVSSLTDIHRREKNLPSNTRMKHIKAYWLRIIKSLREMMDELDILRNKRNYFLFKLMNLTKEFNGCNLLMDTIILSKEALIDQINAIKVAWASEFTETLEFTEEKVENG
jgi:hypothetical protein